MTTKDDVICKTCPYYRAYASDGSRTGQCRRFPPQVNLLNDDGGTTADFPDVGERLWCGEHPYYRFLEAEAGKDA